MKRADLIRQIEALGAIFIREGGGHTIYKNERTNAAIVVPRHREIKEILAQKIIREASRQ